MSAKGVQATRATMVTEHTLLTIVTDTGPCAAQGARHTWPLESPRTAEKHLAQHLMGWFVTRTPSRPSAAPGWVAEGPGNSGT